MGTAFVQLTQGIEKKERKKEGKETDREREKKKINRGSCLKMVLWFYIQFLIPQQTISKTRCIQHKVLHAAPSLISDTNVACSHRPWNKATEARVTIRPAVPYDGVFYFESR